MNIPNITDALVRGSDILDSRRSFPHDRSKYLNASEAENCIRWQWFDKQPKIQGAPQDWGYARRGQHGEKFVIEALQAANVPLLWADDLNHSIRDDELRIAATPDDVIVLEDEWIPLEIKTIDPRTNRRNLPKHNHSTQLDLGIGLISKHLKPTGIKCSRGLILYMDASNYHDVVQFEIHHDPSILERMAKKSTKIFRTRSPEALDREGKRTGDCRLCPYKEPCGVVLEDPSSQTGKANRGSKLDAAVTRFMDIKKLEAEKSDLSETIKQELKARKLSELDIGDFTVKLEVAAGRASLDKKAVEAAGIDLAPFTKTGKPSERLTVSER